MPTLPVADAPLPHAWRFRRWVLLLGGPLFLAVGVVVLLAGPPGPVTLGVAAAASALAVPGCRVLTERTREAHGLRSTTSPEPALELRSSLPRLLLTLWGTLGLTGIGIAIVAGLASGAGFAPLPAVAGAVAVVLAVALWVRGAQRRTSQPRPWGRPVIRLSATGLEVRGLRTSTVLPWDAGVVVTAHPHHRLHLYPAVEVAGYAGSRSERRRWWWRAQRVLGPGVWSSGLLLVAAAIQLYADHPDLRHELGTPLAEERLRRGDLPAPRL